ncbi:MAG: glycosyltransferase family 2 protein [Methylobacterium sp.]|uniref:glycosyltransferase family 2 protein n=1 Tax=Methylobacterium sp. TaxID=409 RepID=UPI000F8FC80F|nr:glycosyltransferase family 2 protein [Methylobacterium sp.]RUP15506.1 MAG: glycosyltransferase family 2 protein [Methylobacterium sp.]
MADQLLSDARGTSVDVSFIMAAHDAAPWIEMAVRSALAQTGVAVEVVAVDDGSRDGTGTVLASLAEADRRVRVISLTGAGPGSPRGPSSARNAALDAALGRWIAILDADDLILPNRSRSLLDLALAADADIVADNPIPFTDVFDPRGPGMMEGGREPYLFEIDLAKYIACNQLLRPGTKLGYLKPMIRAETLNRHKIRYDEGVRIGEDFLLCLEALAAGARFVVTSDAGYGYRRGPTSLSHRLRQADIARLEAAFAARAEHGRLAEARARSAEIRHGSRAYRDGLAMMRMMAQVIEAAQAGRWIQGAALALRHPRMWQSLAATLLEAAGKRLRPRLHALPIGQR